MLALRGATLIDGRGGDPLRPSLVTIEGATVSSVGTGDPPPGANVIDLHGFTLLPGLIDAHVHLGLSSDLDRFTAGHVALTEVAARIFKTCGETLDAGFTTVRDCGGVDGGLVAAIDAGLVRGPHVISAGPIICQTGGHGHWVPPTTNAGPVGWPDYVGLTYGARACDGADQVRHAAREAFRRGASFIKLCVSGGVVSTSDSLDDTQFTIDEIRAAVIEASARHTYVTVHSHNTEGIRNAVAAGARCVEHGSFMDEQTADLMAREHVSHVPTLSVMRLLETNYTEMGLSKAIGDRVAGVRSAQADAIRMTKAAHVLVGAGSDLIGPLQNRRGLELHLRAQITDPMEAIVASTATNARILGIASEVGTVEAGKRADVIAVRGDPLVDPSLFDNPASVALVVKDGVIVKDTLAA